MYHTSHLLTFPTGTKLDGPITARIVKVGKWFSGSHEQHGPWSFQDLEIEDNTGKLAVCLEKRDELAKNWQGALVTFHPGEYQNKPCGLIVEDHTPRASERMPNPKPYRRLRVTQAGNMDEAQQGGQQAPQQRQQPPQQRQQPQGGGQSYSSPTAAHEAHNGRQQARQPQGGQQPQQQRPQQQAPAQNRQQPPAQQQRPTSQQAPEQGGDAWNYIRASVARIAAAKQLCFDAAVANAWDVYERHGIKFSQEAVGAEASGMFIEIMKRTGYEKLDAFPKKLHKKPEDFKGRSLIDLYDRADADRRAYMAQVQQPPAQQQAPARTEDGAQWEQPADQPPAQGEPQTWKEGLENDEIPF